MTQFQKEQTPREHILQEFPAFQVKYMTHILHQWFQIDTIRWKCGNAQSLGTYGSATAMHICIYRRVLRSLNGVKN